MNPPKPSALCGKAFGQESAYQIERLRGGGPAPDPSGEAMDHTLLHVHACIDARGDCAFDEADRVVEKHFVVAHMHTDRREAGQVGEGRRGERVARIVTAQIRPHQFGDLRSCEVRVDHGTSRPASAGQREVCDGRKQIPWPACVYRETLLMT
jgi:hypothetical protein